MKKRVAALTMAAVMAVSAAGCSGGAKESGSQTETKDCLLYTSLIKERRLYCVL